uniref:Uncharacterized protein n=1 Tax=Takifugu rubripes TaxID=31033 RepID=A0A674NT94_TAKRU
MKRDLAATILTFKISPTSTSTCGVVSSGAGFKAPGLVASLLTANEDVLSVLRTSLDEASLKMGQLCKHIDSLPVNASLLSVTAARTANGQAASLIDSSRRLLTPNKPTITQESTRTAQPLL